MRLTKQFYGRSKSALPIGNRVGKAPLIIKEAAHSLTSMAHIVGNLTPFY